MQIPYGKQYISQEDIDAVSAVLRSDYLTQGPEVPAFEQEFADYVGAKYAVAVSNGTAALHLCALALGVGPDSRVITTPITFAASANCIRYCGGAVDFADVCPETALLDVSAVKALLDSAPEGFYDGIIPVDFAGLPVQLQEFRELADSYGLWLIEDACHAPGGYFTGRNGEKYDVGGAGLADFSVFSFHPVKHIACGEGGMIVTNRKDLYERILLLRSHGITKDPSLLFASDGGWYYEMLELGYNYRFTDIQAALGRSQLTRARSSLERRRSIARRYDEAFVGTKVRPLAAGREGHAYHLYVIRVENRKGLYDSLREVGIFSQVHYIPVHLMPYYKALGYDVGDFPRAEFYYQECLSIPMYPTLSEEEQGFVIDSVLRFCGE